MSILLVAVKVVAMTTYNGFTSPAPYASSKVSEVSASTFTATGRSCVGGGGFTATITTKLHYTTTIVNAGDRKGGI